MEALAQEWTEGRLDELSSKVDKGFERVDRRFDGVDRRFDQVNRRFEQVDRRFEQVDRRFEKVDAAIGGLRLEMTTEFTAVRAEMKETRSELVASLNSVQRTMVQMMVALTAAILAGFAGICTLIATQL